VPYISHALNIIGLRDFFSFGSLTIFFFPLTSSSIITLWGSFVKAVINILFNVATDKPLSSSKSRIEE